MTATGSTTVHRPTSLRVDSAVLGMALFLMTEAMLFAGLISACIVLRASQQGPWPPDNQPRLPIALTLGNMAVLLASGAALAISGRRPRGVALTAALAAVFLTVQGYEWSRLISFGLGTGTGPYAGIFYGLIGTHALHVIGGLGCLLWCWREVGAGRLQALRICRMYWYFVVGVWPVLYLLVYV